MEEEITLDSRKKFPPYYEGKNVSLRVEEVIKILKNVKESDLVTGIPEKPLGGDVYIFKALTDSNLEDWKNDGLKWKSTGTAHLPRQKKPLINKRMYSLLNEDSSVNGSLKKDVYSWEIGEGVDNLFLIHYVGKPGEPETQTGDEITDSTKMDQTSATAVTEEQAEVTQESAEPLPATDTESGNQASPGTTSAAEATTAQEPNVENRTELEAAMKAMQAALGTRAKSTPVMDVFNKLMETMVSNKDSSDLELCLVVADKKSGESSVVGSEAAKKIVSTPEVRKSARKRRPSTDEDEDGQEEDGEDKTPVGKPTNKRLKVSSTAKKPANFSRTEDENEVTLANGKTEKIPVPKKEVFFSPLIVSNEEKRIHHDFFDNSHPNRTKEKYLRLRNHIINRWSRVKPLYLGSNQARKFLQKAGDVGVFRRIHKYLECKGVINFDATTERALLDEGGSEEESEEEPPAPKAKQTPAAKTAAKKKSTPVDDHNKSAPGRKPRGRPHGSTSEKKAIKIKEEPKEDESVLLSPSGRSRRNVATPNWAEILGGRATFYKDAGLAKDTHDDTSEGDSVRKRGRPRKNVTDDEADEPDETEENTDAVVTQRGRGRPKKDGGVSKPKEVEDSEAAATPRPRGRPRKDDSSSVAKNQATESGETTDSARKRGRPRKIPVDNESEEETEKVSKSAKGKRKVDEGSGGEDGEEDGENEEEMETEESNKDAEGSTPFKSSSGARTSTRIQYNHVCTVCKKGFALKYLLKEHMAIHGKATVKKENTDDNDDDDYTEMSDDQDEEYHPAREEMKEMEEDDGAENDDGDNEDADVKPKKQHKSVDGKVPTKLFRKAGKEQRPMCNVCGTVFLTQGNLRKHYLLHSDKMYECPYCAKLMKRKDYVVAHVRKCHKEIDLDQVPIDFKKFTHVLSQNMEGEVTGEGEGDSKEFPEDEEKENKTVLGKSRTGLGKSVCPDCMNVFDSNGDLEQHMLVVHRKDLQDATYKCQACKKEFKTLVSYQVHKLTHRKKEHECPHCGAVFRTNSQLQVHKRHDHNIQYGTLMYFGFLMNKDRVTCEICSADFDSMSDYHDHRPEHLTLEYLCRECGNGFMTEDELQKHTDSNCSYQNLHLPCGVCSQKFTMYDTRRKHMVTNHKKTSDFYCHHCGACFLDLESLRTHFVLHKSERIFECEFCEKRFFEKRNLVDHRELHRDNKSFQCNICDRYYISSKSLQRHIKLHLSKDSRFCQTCDQKFTTNEELMRHMKEVHSTVRGDNSDKDMENFQHKCNICGRKFLFKSRLIKHMQIHDEDKKPDLYQCPHCSKMFDTAIMPLWKHMKQEHPEELKKRSFKKEMMCEMCGFTTVHKQRLERHMETHNPEKKFQCRYCEKMFQTTSSMLTHMIIHRGKIKKGVKKHSDCSWPNCSKSFLKHSNMKRHLLSHIFKVKVNKDWCDCKNCEKRNEEILEGAGDYEYFEDDGTGSFVKLSSEAMMSRGIPSGTDDGQIKLVINNAGGVEGYESMDVLQEAIAQIEDIEKNAGNPSVVTGELTQATQTSNVEATAEDGTQLDGTQVATDVNRQRDNSVETSGQEVNAEQQVEGVPEGIGHENEQTLAEADTTEDPAEATVPNVHFINNPSTNVGDQGIIECIYECGVCDLMFETKCQVLFHLEDEHIDNRFPKCDECNKFYIDKKNLNEHRSIHLGSREFTCEVCSKNFRTKQCLRQHQYIHAEIKPFICSYCGHGFTQRGFFDEHVRRHTGDRPFRCIICTKGFVSKNLLKLHMYSHTGNKPHKCEHCPKAFAENYQLVAHLRTHNDDRPFQCTECDKAFFVKPKLIRHMNTVHSIEKEYLSNYVPTKIGDGIGYRDKTKLKNYKPERKTQVVYIDGQGNIISQEIKTERELRQQKEKIRTQKPHVQKVIRPQSSANPVVVIQPPVASTRETMTESGQGDSFEVVTRRDSTGQIQVNTVLERPEHVIIENDGMPMAEQVVMQNTDGSETIVSIPEHSENIVYQEMESGTEGSIELNGQNYTLVTQADGSGQNQLQLITQALAGVQAQNEVDQGRIQVITEEIANEDMQTDEDGSIQIYTQEAVDGVQEGAENISINIGEDGTVDAADFEKIEALRSLYNDQPIVIVLESQQQE